MGTAFVLLFLMVVSSEAMEMTSSGSSTGEGKEEVDSMFVTQFFQEFLDQVVKETEEQDWSCVTGLQYKQNKEDLKLANGEFQHLKSILGERTNVYAEILEESGDELLKAVVGFEFPANMVVKYNLDYDYSGTFDKDHFPGLVQFGFGHIVIRVAIKVPKSKTAVNNLKKRKMCINEIKPADILTYSDGPFTTYGLKINSPELYNTGRGRVPGHLSNLGKDFMINLGYYLERLIVNAVIEKSQLNCLDKEAKTIWPQFNKDIDCSFEKAREVKYYGKKLNEK